MSTINTTEKKPNIIDFILIWFGQLISIIGSGLTGFALGVWVYQSTGSVTYFSLIVLFTTLPGLLIRPLGGVIADRFSRRIVMVISDFGASLGTLFIALIIWTGKLEIWHIYVGMGFSSLCSGIQNPSYLAAITQLVPKSFYAQASGMMQASASAQYLISPLIAGLLIKNIGLTGIIIIDFATFIIAVIILAFIKIKPPDESEEGQKGKDNFLILVKNVFTYLFDRFGLFILVLLLTACNFFLGFLIVLIGPMILSFSTPKMLGIGESISAIGMLVTSVLVSIFGAPKRLVKAIIISMMIAGIGYAFIGVRTNLFTIIIPCFTFFLAIPVINACIDTIIRKKVVHDMQGRVYAIMTMLLQTGLILAYIIAGPVADYIFEPLFVEGGALVSTVGRIIGTGQGRGIGFLFIISGVIIVLISIVSFSIKKVRNLEKDMGDVIE